MRPLLRHPVVLRARCSAWLVALLLCLGPALACLPAMAQTSDDKPGFTQLRKQGVHYARKKLWLQAIQVLEQARRMPGHGDDFRTLFTLAKVYYEILHMEKAFPLAEALVDVAETEKQEEDSRRFLQGLQDRFGGVTFRKAPEQKGELKNGVIHLEDKGGLINPKKKQLFERIASRFRKTPVELPITIYLPFGTYTANRSLFTVEKGKVDEATLFLYNPDEGLSAWWYVGGAAVLTATTATVVLLLLGEEETEQREVLRIERVGFRGATR